MAEALWALRVGPRMLRVTREQALFLRDRIDRVREDGLPFPVRFEPEGLDHEVRIDLTSDAEVFPLSER